ncbi:hypothetical protein [Actinoplanes sp. NPDC048796]|uniref:hypothetical protein n=1 Tax=unclassified Actinoplanes TaxID=2626549 RepID=UPI0033D310D5
MERDQRRASKITGGYEAPEVPLVTVVRAALDGVEENRLEVVVDGRRAHLKGRQGNGRPADCPCETDSADLSMGLSHVTH